MRGYLDRQSFGEDGSDAKDDEKPAGQVKSLRAEFRQNYDASSARNTKREERAAWTDRRGQRRRAAFLVSESFNGIR
jgi:hypothetical protein